MDLVIAGTWESVSVAGAHLPPLAFLGGLALGQYFQKNFQLFAALLLALAFLMISSATIPAALLQSPWQKSMVAFLLPLAALKIHSRQSWRLLLSVFLLGILLAQMRINVVPASLAIARGAWPSMASLYSLMLYYMGSGFVLAASYFLGVMMRKKINRKIFDRLAFAICWMLAVSFFSGFFDLFTYRWILFWPSLSWS